MLKENGNYNKLKKLKTLIQGMTSVVVLYSGGLDSSFLLWVCSQVLPADRLKAITFRSATTPNREIHDAKKIAAYLNVNHNIYSGPEMKNEEFLANDLLRCYYCKRERFIFLLSLQVEFNGYTFIDGSVIDDLEDFRPGMRAAQEAGIASPLMEAGISKEDINYIALDNELSFAGKRKESCLATRIKIGHRIEVSILEKIHTAENSLYELGFELVRLRWNEGEARLEFTQRDLESAWLLRQEIIQRVQACGFSKVSLDLEGYI
jgi:uncharacterized protein